MILTRSTRRAAALATVVAIGVGVAGCGLGIPAKRSLSVTGVPLPAGTRVIVRVHRCNGGAHAFCALQFVLVAAAGRYPSSDALLAAETAQLHRVHWGQAQGDTIHESAAESPGHRLRVTYATANLDLQAIDESRIQRAPTIARALSREMYARASALSIMLQAGSS